jgi:hypothetical protein
MTVKLNGAQGAPDRALIAGVEKEIGGDLPASYLAFVDRFNGAVPEGNLLWVPTLGISTSIQQFIPLSELAYELKLANFARFPGLVPIAFDGTGNFICLSLAGRHAGEVYFLDHEMAGEPSGLSRVAGSVQELLEMLQPFDPLTVECSPDQLKFSWIDPEFLAAIKKKE